ncbi:MAG: hypothetical protein WCX88_04645 [Patescibacteria group bacterium]
MSHKFVEVKGYETPSENDNTLLLEFLEDKSTINKNHVTLFVPPVEGNYYKALLECSINIFFKYTDEMSLNLLKDGSHLTVDGIDEEIIMALKQIASGLQYLINSNSWKSGDLKSSDAEEIFNNLDLSQKLFKKILNRK